mgnify:FL=1
MLHGKRPVQSEFMPRSPSSALLVPPLCDPRHQPKGLKSCGKAVTFDHKQSNEHELQVTGVRSCHEQLPVLQGIRGMAPSCDRVPFRLIKALLWDSVRSLPIR